MARQPWRLTRWTLSVILTISGLLSTGMLARQAITPPPAAAAGAWSGNSAPGSGSYPWQPMKSIKLDAWLSVGVNVYNGNVMVTTKALQMPGVQGFDLNIDPLYNSLNRSYITDMGKGWGMGLGRDVGLDLSSPTTPVFHDPSGATYTFSQSVCGSQCTYTSPPGIDATLSYDSSSGYALGYHASGDIDLFNTNGYLTAMENRGGKTISFTYDTNGRLTQILSTEGQIITVTYNALNQVATISAGGNNGTTRTWTYGYDGANRLQTINDPLSHVTQFSYDSNNDVTGIVDPLGNTTLLTYSGTTLTKITRVTNPSNNTGPVWQFGFGSSAVVTDPNNHTTSYAFDGGGREISMADAEGHSTLLAWTGDNQISQETPPGSGATAYSYDSLNNLTKTTLATGAYTAATYNTSGSLPYLPTTTTDAQGNTTTYQYSAAGLPTYEKDGNGNITQWQYDIYNNLLDMIAPNGSTTSYTYNSSGLLSSVVLASTITHSYTYDATYMKSTETDGNNNTTTYNYDALGELTAVTSSDNKVILYTYDADGNLTNRSTVSSTAVVSNGGFESGQSPWQISSATSDTVIDTAAADAHTGTGSAHLCGVNNCNDEIWENVTLPRSFVNLTLSYFVRLNTQEPPGSGANDCFNARVRTTSGTVISSGRTYCASPYGLYLNHWIQITDDLTSLLAPYAGQQVQVYFQGVTDGANPSNMYVDDVSMNLTPTTGYKYNALNQQIEEDQPDGTRTAYTYDGVGNMLSKGNYGSNGILGQSLQYTYTPRDQVATLVNAQGQTRLTTSFTYDADNALTTEVYPNSVTQTWSYNNAKQLQSVSAKNSGGTTLTSFTYSYVNPATSKATEQRYSVTDASGNVTTYSYDAANRLLSSTTKNSSGTTTDSRTYQYDKDGNITSENLNGTVTSATYNQANEVTSSGYAFDGNGNETVSPGLSNLTYNTWNQTTSITPAGGSATPLSYLGTDQKERTGAGVNTEDSDSGGVWNIFAAWGSGFSKCTESTNVARTPSGQMVSEYVSKNCLTSQVNNVYFLFDGQGSVVGLANSSGSLVDQYSYDPYGNLIGTPTQGIDNSFQYIGAERDSTGLYKTGERYYDPTLGRFTQTDPAACSQTTNVYWYGKSDPVNDVDPDGTISLPPVPKGLACTACKLIGSFLLGQLTCSGIGAWFAMTAFCVRFSFLGPWGPAACGLIWEFACRAGVALTSKGGVENTCRLAGFCPK